MLQISPMILLKKSTPLNKLATYSPANQVSQPTQHILDSAYTSPQLEINPHTANEEQTVFTNKPLESNPEKENSMETPLRRASESTSEVEHCKTLSSKMKSIREITNCSPDTTTSATPQYLSSSDVNIAAISKTDNDAACNSTSCTINLEKRLRTTLDDCDNDIPSPVYSPYEGKRKPLKDNERSKSKISVTYPSLSLTESQSDVDAITPIDLRFKASNNDCNDSIDSTISTNMTIKA